MVCTSCSTKLHAVRHSCTFINATTDMYCGGCGQSLLRIGSLVKRRPVEEFVESAAHFSEQELLQLLDLQHHTIKASKRVSISQLDVDKLFQ
ncbi:MAG: hypothetical protein NTV54_10630 [Ignavibacteriales bacterium]|nr:hypothetical protein [Ignavibacteriales bacterium]